MKLFRALPILFLAVCLQALCQGQAKAKPIGVWADAQLKNIELPSLPWHMMVIYWHFKDSIPDFNRLDIDITIDRDIPDAYNLYISPVNSDFNGETFYGGLQTNINGWANKESRKRVHPGKGGIFSRWSKDKKTPIGLEHVDMLENGLCESAGYEGEFCSVRRPYPWTKGVYTFSLVKEETVLFKDTLHTWVALEVTDKNKSEAYRIGRLLFLGDTLKLRQNIAAFLEIYSTEKIPKSDIPEARVTFGYPRINGRELPLYNVMAMYPTSGQASSPNVAEVTSENNDISVSIAPVVKPSSKNNIYQFIELKGGLQQR
ncbi:MAG: hypothetical protein LBF67_04825 [Prevotellaceae bacterium]|jgi:hypothetical protein|nr:hypothetical protein [Prevotellaceae bacterium]